jgi:hypothetical protein
LAWYWIIASVMRVLSTSDVDIEAWMIRFRRRLPASSNGANSAG